MEPVQIILIFVIVLVIAGTGFFLILNQQAKRKQRAISLIMGTASTEVKKASAADEQNKRRAEIAKKLKGRKGNDDEGGDKKKKPTLSIMLEQAGWEISIKQYWIFSVISMVVVLVLAKIMGAGSLMLVLSAVIGFFGVPKLVVRHMTKGRQKKFLEEFPDALDAMTRLLKSGMPVSEAIAMISKEFTGPIGEEMSRIYDKQKIGVPLHEAAQEAMRRMPLTEVQMFATGLSIQAQTGSSLSEVLQNLSNVIRARFKLKRKIKALSSEAIASASIIGALPILLALGMYFTNREYIMILFEDSFGNILLAGAVVWMSLGIVVMKVMINFKI